MKIFLQCPTGISGDMFLSALADLGVDFRPLQELLQDAGLPVELHFWQEKRGSILGTRCRVQSREKNPPARNIHAILDLLEQTRLSAELKKKIEGTFWRLARVEASVHGQSPEDVHFHEVGAVDSLVDIIGAFWGMGQLADCTCCPVDIDEVICTPLPWFQGRAETAHGTIPLPAPATLRLLQGKPVYPTDFEKELVTPTGALLVDQMVDRFASGPLGKITAIGLGLGSYELKQMPNCLRLIVIDPADALSLNCHGLRDGFASERQGSDGAASPWKYENIWVLESNIDHLTGEEIGNLFEVLFAAGALDVIFLQGIMKKNRPGGQLQVLCRDRELCRVQEVFFRETMTLGIRYFRTGRAVLHRKEVTRNKDPEMELKGCILQDGCFYRPEFEALKKLAKKTGRSVVQLRYLLGRDDLSFADDE